MQEIGSRTRVVHLVEDLGVGGLERVIECIVLGLNRRRYGVAVWCLAGGGEIADGLIEKGYTVRIMGMDSYYNPYNVVRLARMMKKNKVDILHTHGYFGGTFGRLAGMLAGIPIMICHIHSTYHEYKKRNILIERFLALFTDKIVCISRAVQRFVVKTERIRQEKTRVVLNGAHFPKLGECLGGARRQRESMGFQNDEVVVTVVASLTTNKGHRVLLDAISLLSATKPKIRLLIVGDGPLRSELEVYARQVCPPSTVVFVGRRGDVFNLLTSSDIFVLPSLGREGLGIAIIEAMAAGLPVVGTRIGGIPEVIEDGHNGLLVDPYDSLQLAAALRKLSDSRKMRAEMGMAGRRLYAERFTDERMVQEIELLYNDLVRRRIG